MDYDIKRNSLDNHNSVTKTINQCKTFQEKPIKKYKNRNNPINDDFKYVRNIKLKKGFKPSDNKIVAGNDMSKSLRLDSDSESFSYKSFNGNNKSQKNVSHNFDRNNLMNRATNDYPRNINYEPKTNFVKDKFEGYRHHEFKCSNEKDSESKNVPKNERTNGDRPKWTFLQESQLNVDKCEASSEVSAVTSHSSSSSNGATKSSSSNGLNPAAVEFTPNLSSLGVPRITEALEYGVRTLSLDHQGTISNPVVVVEPSQHPYPGGKIGTTLGLSQDSSPLLQSVFQCRAPSRLNFPSAPQNMVPQFQLLYGPPNPTQLIRYNPAQNMSPLPLHLQGNYILYNPSAMLFNPGMYNPGPSLLTNRLVPLATGDLSVGVGHLSSTSHIAHSLAGGGGALANYSPYYTDPASSINGGPHIR